MVSNAEQLRADPPSDSSDSELAQARSRPAGHSHRDADLRRLSLDELPQVWNVTARGEMSMVGPRPLIPAEDERVLGWARGRLDLTPGITGYWQVLGRTRIPFDEMVKLDYLYVMNWSLWEDVRLSAANAAYCCQRARCQLTRPRTERRRVVSLCAALPTSRQRRDVPRDSSEVGLSATYFDSRTMYPSGTSSAVNSRVGLIG